MYGLIGKVTAVAGKRDALIAAMIGGSESMPGCLSYVVAKDPTEPETIWVTEVWDSRESHRASLKIESVKAVIGKAMPLIAEFGLSVETEVVGGHGLG